MRRGFAFLAGLALAAVSTSAAIACSCFGYRTAKAQFEAVDVAFVGTVESQESYKGPQDVDLVRTRFAVAKTLKGEALPSRTVGHAADDGGNCGIDFAEGQTVLVFAHQNPAGLMTSSCSAPGWPLEEFERLAAARK